MEERTGGFGAVKKKRGKFNSVDILFVVLLVAVLFTVFFLINPFSTNIFGGNEREVVLEYTVEIEYVEASLADNVKLGDEAISAVNKTSLGRVSAIKNDILYAEAYYNSEADTVSMKEYPDRYNVQVTITSDAIFEEGKGYTVKGTRIAVGGQYSIMFPNYLGGGYCISMREVG
ncbi:MAG: DUF4330 family protein [Clostridia bacterium]|nr:DUF4330 family protein [Clostridia bacterium]